MHKSIPIQKEGRASEQLRNWKLGEQWKKSQDRTARRLAAWGAPLGSSQEKPRKPGRPAKFKD